MNETTEDLELSRVVQELDLRHRALPDCGPVVLGAFDALQAGQALRIVADDDAQVLWFQLQEQRADRFEWRVLEPGPERFRIQIERRSTARPPSIMESLVADHERLDRTLADVVRLTERGALLTAAETFAELRVGLTRHMDVEEQVLLPTLARLNRRFGNPVAEVGQEHQRLRGQVVELSAALAAPPSSPPPLLERLRLELLLHHLREEDLFYPLSDALAGDEQGRAELRRRLQWM